MQKHPLPLFLLITFAGVGLAVYACLGNFTRMLADDFCSIYFADRLGLFRSTWYWYLNWSGRYTAFAWDWFVLEFVLGPYNLHYIVPVSILLWLLFGTLAVYFYLRKKDRFAFLHSLTLAGIFLFVVFMLSPNISQSLFWWNGMRSYALPLVALTAYIFMYQLIIKDLKMALIWKCGLGFVLLFLSGGMGETIAVAQAVFILFLVSLHVLKLLKSTRDELPVLYSSLVGAVCSIIVVILSPGNAIRQAFLPPSPDLITLATISLRAYGSFLREILLEPVKAVGLIGAVLVAFWIGGHYKDRVPVGIQPIPAYILGGLAISFACFPPGVYGYSEPPPARTMIIPIFFLIGGVLCAGFVAGGRLNEKYEAARLSSNALVLLSLLMVGFSFTATTWGLYNERQVYIDFAQKWDAVDARILQAKADNLELVNIPAMDNWAGLERPNDNKNYWPTLCYSSYYDIQVFGPPYP